MSSIAVVVWSGIAARICARYRSRSHMYIILRLRSVEFVNARRRSFKSPTEKPGIADSPILGISMGLRLGRTPRRIAQHVSALFNS